MQRTGAFVRVAEAGIFFATNGMLQANSNPRIVPVEEANLVVSIPMRCNIETNRFGSG